MSTPRRRALGGTGFTLVEVLVSTTLVIFLLLILVNITNQTGKIWKYTTGKVEQFREAREAFESMNRRLSQATLNTYWDYDNSAAPTKYLRKSELRFQSGIAATPALLDGSASDHPTHTIFFQAPLGYTTPSVTNPGQSDYPGLENLLNTCGYYIQYGADLDRPTFITTAVRNRYRLMEYVQPSEKLSIYTNTSAAGWPPDVKQSQPGTTVVPYTRAIAENIIALVIIPKLSVQEETDSSGAVHILAPNYAYDSATDGPNSGTDLLCNTKNQLPPEVQVTMIAIDEASAVLLASLNSGAMPTLVDPQWFNSGTHNAAGYADDLKSLQQKLTAKPAVNYRVFSTNVRIRGAKWSRQ